MKVMAPKLVNVQSGSPGDTEPKELLNNPTDFTTSHWHKINTEVSGDVLNTVKSNEDGAILAQLGFVVITGVVYQVTFDVEYKTGGASHVAMGMNFYDEDGTGYDYQTYSFYGGAGWYFKIDAGTPTLVNTMMSRYVEIISTIITDNGDGSYTLGGKFKRTAGSSTDAGVSFWVNNAATNWSTPPDGTDVYLYAGSLNDDTTTRTDPIPGTVSNFESTNVALPAESNEAEEWNPDATYGRTSLVYLSTTWRKYECVAETSTGQYPPKYGQDGDEFVWLDRGYVNAYQMFQQTVDTFTVNQGTIEVELKPGKINSFGLLGLNCGQVDVVMTTPGGTVVYDITVDMAIPAEAYFDEDNFVEQGYRRTLTRTNLPIYETATIKFTLSWPGEPTRQVSCGLCLVGIAQYVGAVRYGARAGIMDFSRIERDSFGGLFLDKGRYANRMEVDLAVPMESVDLVKQRLTARRGTLSLWIGGPEDQSS